MPLIERDVVLVGKDNNGNVTMDMPITKLQNIEDTAQVKETPAAEDYIPIADSADGGQMKKAQLAKLSAVVGGIPTVTTAGTGAAYTATVPGVTELYKGLHITVIPHVVSSSTTPTLNVNGLGAKSIRRNISTTNEGTTAGYSSSWLTAFMPVLLEYNGTYWVAVGREKPMATDLYGTVAVGKGGTGKTSFTANRLIYPSGSTTLSQLAFPTADGSVLMQNKSGAPYWTAKDDLAVAFTEAETRENIASGEKLGTLFGKVKKWFTDLGAHLSDTSAHVTAAEKQTWNAKPGSSDMAAALYELDTLKGQLNDHVWMKQTAGIGLIIDEQENISTHYSGDNTTAYYADSVQVNADNKLVLVDKQTTKINTSNMNTLRGKYWSTTNTSYYDVLSFTPDEDGAVSVYNQPAQAPNGVVGYITYINIKRRMVRPGWGNEYQYIRAANANAYPIYGEQSGATYTYLGTAYESALRHIETVEWLGTGLYGSNKETILTFPRPPVLVMITEQNNKDFETVDAYATSSSTVYMQAIIMWGITTELRLYRTSTSTPYPTITYDNATMKISNTKSADLQLNSQGTLYRAIAFY